MRKYTIEELQERESRKEHLKELRTKGFTYDEIGQMCGVSRQRVQQIIGEECKGYFRPITKKKCIYSAIREWMNDNKISITEFTRRVYGNTAPANYERMKARLNGSRDLTKTYIDKILSITGLTYEEAFKRSDAE